MESKIYTEEQSTWGSSLGGKKAGKTKKGPGCKRKRGECGGVEKKNTKQQHQKGEITGGNSKKG